VLVVATKRAAQLAKSGKGKRVRFQGGTLFPMLVLAVLVIGVGTIVYARASVPARRRLRAHHRGPLAHGLRLLALRPPGHDRPARRQPRGAVEPELQRLQPHRACTATTTGSSTGTRSRRPRSAAATLGLFLENYGVELTDDRLTFPADQNGGKEYVEGETKCPDGEDGELSVHRLVEPEDTSTATATSPASTDIKLQKTASC
jgi:hypothetical protein